MQRTFILALILAIFASLLLVACSGLGVTNTVTTSHPLTATLSPTPDFTRQTAAAQTQAAQSTAQAQAAAATDIAFQQRQVEIEGTAMAAERTKVAFEILVTATEQARVAGMTQVAAQATATRQAAEAVATQFAGNGTSTAWALAAVGTQTAQAFSSNATAFAQHTTATAVAGYEQSSGTATAVALNILTAQEEAARQRIAAQSRIEQATGELRGWVEVFAPWLIVFAAVALLFWGFWHAGQRLLPALGVALGVIRYGKDGKPQLVWPTRDGGVIFADLSRNPGPAIKVDAQGMVSNPISSDPETLRQSAMENLARAVIAGEDARQQGQLRQAVGQVTRSLVTGGTRSQVTSLQPEGYRILPPVLDQLPPGALDVIEGDWRNADE
ncbi:MAG TPA: hypothetical protein PKG95_04450 [Anaerolineaceae bacterium]|nr:hypothetical protein [Anaerolineaceae bacterium]